MSLYLAALGLFSANSEDYGILLQVANKRSYNHGLLPIRISLKNLAFHCSQLSYTKKETELLLKMNK